MDAVDLAKRMERERLFWVEVAPGKRFQFLRPMTDEAPTFVGGVSLIAHMAQYLRGWDGLVEGDFVKGGGTDPVEFDARVGTSLLRDHMGWTKKVADAMGREIANRIKATEDVEKNSETSST